VEVTRAFRAELQKAGVAIAMLDGATNWQEVHRRFVSKKLTIKQRGAGLSIEDETRRSIRASAVDRLWHRITREAVRPVPGRCLDHRPLTLQEAQAFAQVMRGAGLHERKLVETFVTACYNMGKRAPAPEGSEHGCSHWRIEMNKARNDLKQRVGPTQARP